MEQQFTKSSRGFSLIGGFFKKKKRLVIGLGCLLVLAQKQGWMTSGPHLGLFFLLLWQIESEGRKEIGVFPPPPPPPKEVCDTGVWVRDQSVVYNPKNTFYKANEIKELEYIEKERINFQEIKVPKVIIELLL